MSLATIAASFDRAVQEEFRNVKNDALELLAEIVEDAGHAIEHLVEQTKGTATKLVVTLINDDSLSGLAKANLAATQLVEHYALQGIEIASLDATFIIKNAYEAVAAFLRSRES